MLIAVKKHNAKYSTTKELRHSAAIAKKDTSHFVKFSVNPLDSGSSPGGRQEISRGVRALSCSTTT